MTSIVVFELPAFDTGQYQGCEFKMAAGGATRDIQVAESGDIRIAFQKVRWHQFTAVYNCTAELISGAYFRLVEVSSPKVSAFVAADTAGRRAYSELHHYRIFLDETGCHEVFAESFSAA